MNERRMLRIFTGFTASREDKEARQAYALSKKRGRLELFQIQEDAKIDTTWSISSRDRGDLDTNRGAAGQKTWRGGPPKQERDQRGYSHRA